MPSAYIHLHKIHVDNTIKCQTLVQMSRDRANWDDRKLSLDDCLEDLDNIIKDAKERKSRHITEAEEIAQVNQILKEDGYNESDIFFAQALSLCTQRLYHRAFLGLVTKEGQYNYVKVTLDMMTLKSK